MSLTRYSIRNPLIVNLLTSAILLLGAIAFLEMPRELNPKISFHYIFIITPFPGAGAEDVEKLITVKIEDALQDVDDVKMISSESNEGGSFVWLQFEDISDRQFREYLSEVETEVNRLELPEGSLDPRVEEFDTDNFIPVISFSITGKIPEREFNDLAADMRNDLLNINGISQVARTGTREREIWVELDRQALLRHRLSISQVAAMISARNLNVPAGEVTRGSVGNLVRTIGEVDTPEGFSRIVVRGSPDGHHIYLGQIATITDRRELESTRSRMDGAPSVTLSISKRANASSLDVIETAKAVAEKYRSRIPLDSKIVVTYDNSIYIKDILNKLQYNAILGFLLVILTLYLFMGLRNAVIVAVGIPVAFAATFLLMRQTGQSLNGSSLFGLMLVLGIVVDDAIIVVENCYRHFQHGLSRSDAAVIGTSEVAWPVISATLTTIAAFLPLVLMTGIMGKFMRIIPIVVSLTLVASLIEVFLIAPSHFVEWGGGGHLEASTWISRLRRLYSRVLIKTIRKRYLAGGVVFLLVIFLGLMIQLVGVELFSGDEFSQFMIWVTMAPGTSLDDTDRVIRHIEKEAQALPPDEVHTVIANTGFMQQEADWIYADNVGQVIVDLVEKEFRRRSMPEIMEDMRNRIAKIAGPVSVRVKAVTGGPPTGKAVEIKVKGKYLDELMLVAEELKKILADIPGVKDISDDNLRGKQEIRAMVIEERAALYGLTARDIAAEVRGAVSGIKATVFHEADEEVDVLVKVAGGEGMGIDELRQLPLITPTGAQIRLDQVCDFEVKPTIFRIKRFERERAITVSAEVDRRIVSPVKVNKIVQERFAEVVQRYPGYNLDFRGEFKEFNEAFNQLLKLFLIGVILIFTILGAQFKSVRQSLIILMTIPFAFIGSMIGLLVNGYPFSIITMFGMVALAGIAVNDAIVMISFINDSRAAGAGRWRSIVQAGRIRLVPIILTTITTIGGLIPMAVGLGGKSDTWAPLANTIAWGLAASSVMTLLIIPTYYTIVVDEWFGIIPLKKRFRRKFSRGEGGI